MVCGEGCSRDHLNGSYILIEEMSRTLHQNVTFMCVKLHDFVFEKAEWQNFQ